LAVMYNVTMLKNKIQEKMIEAMKAKDPQKTSVYRMLYSQIKNVEIDKQKEISDEEVLQVIKKTSCPIKGCRQYVYNWWSTRVD